MLKALQHRCTHACIPLTCFWSSVLLSSAVHLHVKCSSGAACACLHTDYMSLTLGVGTAMMSVKQISKPSSIGLLIFQPSW